MLLHYTVKRGNERVDYFALLFPNDALDETRIFVKRNDVVAMGLGGIPGKPAWSWERNSDAIP